MEAGSLSECRMGGLGVGFRDREDVPSKSKKPSQAEMISVSQPGGQSGSWDSLDHFGPLGTSLDQVGLDMGSLQKSTQDCIGVSPTSCAVDGD